MECNLSKSDLNTPTARSIKWIPAHEIRAAACRAGGGARRASGLFWAWGGSRSLGKSAEATAIWAWGRVGNRLGWIERSWAGCIGTAATICRTLEAAAGTAVATEAGAGAGAGAGVADEAGWG